MSIWFYIFICLIAVINIATISKIFFMKKSVKEMNDNLKEILKSDTNNLITISTSDKEIKNLAQDLNENLKNLREQRLQYENGNQELKKIITNISHDMRTPLTAIKGYIDLLKEANIEEKQQEYLSIIERKTGDLVLLTEQLFEFSKIMDTEIKIEKENCCINGMLEDALTNYYTIFKEKNIIPDINLCEEKVYRIVDKNAINRVLDNILSNISKYSSGDLKVILEKNGKIIFSNKAETLDATTVQKIFNRYFTVENAKKSTGIGLAIAKQLVELNGGSITAQYENGYLIIEIIL